MLKLVGLMLLIGGLFVTTGVALRTALRPERSVLFRTTGDAAEVVVAGGGATREQLPIESLRGVVILDGGIAGLRFPHRIEWVYPPQAASIVDECQRLRPDLPIERSSLDRR